MWRRDSNSPAGAASRRARNRGFGRAFALGIAGLASAGVLAACSNIAAPTSDRARIYTTQPGQTLTVASRATPERIVSKFLRPLGVGRAVDHLRLVRENYRARAGVTHLRYNQEIDGFRVVGAYVKATMTDRGELLHVIEKLAQVPAQGLAVPQITERDALNAAMQHLGYGFRLKPGAVARNGNMVTYARHPSLYSAPTVERVAFQGADGKVQQGFEVETWTRVGNRLRHTLVDASGRVVSSVLRTAADSYNVFRLDPVKSAQTIVNGPGAGNAESPVGWLDPGSQSTVDISGNNVRAYLDTDNNNRADRGGSTVSDGNFTTAADLAAQPSTEGNQAVAVQNLFYLNNLVHDALYRHGFTEAAGNFQNDNFGNGGAERDAVQAEAQDGGGTDNANFATPRDGRAPRMQMYLWTGNGPTKEVFVNSPAGVAGSYGAAGAEFGKALTDSGITGDVVVVDDGVGTGSDGCEAIQNDVSGKIAFVDRGNCTFVVKATNAQAAGATAVIVANNIADDGYFTMGGTDRKIRIYAAMISYEDGEKLRLAPFNATLRNHANPPQYVDGDLDSDIVFHEYGHGLTWRMIGSMSGPMSGALGEGSSDVLALMMNGGDTIGEYSISDPIGIRRDSYNGYPRTYADFAGEYVHDDGEIYAAAMWRVIDLFGTNGIDKDVLFGYWVDGMNYTPAGPTFEEMRDGTLAAINNTAGALAEPHGCLVWAGFAQFGIGVGADGSTSPPTASFEVPANCQ